MPPRTAPPVPVQSAVVSTDGLSIHLRAADGAAVSLPLGRFLPSGRAFAHPEVTCTDVQLEGRRLRLRLSDGGALEARVPRCLDAHAWQPGDPVDLLLVGARQILTGAPGPGALVTIQDKPKADGTPRANDALGLLPEGAVAIAAGRVVAVGPERDVCRVAARDDATTVVDAEGRLVTPGLVDPHTHPVFAGNRAPEFALRCQGATYQEIAAAGGGIRATVQPTRAAGEVALLRGAAERLQRLLAHGVTTLEAKSGYALEPAGEQKLLRVLHRLGHVLPLDVSPTFLGAHVVPPEYAERAEDYVAQVCEEMIPEVASQRLAESVDVFCEEGAFSRAQSERILRCARDAGLAVRIHAEQFTDQGGAAMAAALGAVSADHLEAISADGIAALAQAGTVAVLLPGAALTLRCPWPPVSALRAAGVQMALGTDLNPGTSMTTHLPLMMSIGCTQMGMTVDEAWRGVTVAAAQAALRPQAGRLAPGAPGDFVLWDAAAPEEIPYCVGENLVHAVYRAGRCVLRAPQGPVEEGA